MKPPMTPNTSQHSQSAEPGAAQRVRAGKLPRDRRVGHGIKLLEDIAQHQRQGEGDDQPGGAPWVMSFTFLLMFPPEGFL